MKKNLIMYGIDLITVCIAGKNQCAIDALNYLIKINKNFNIVSLVNKSDKGKDCWQKSFKKYSKKRKIKIVKIHELYNLKKLYLFSFEYENLLKVNKFKSKNLFNFHFSLLPKYRGCHTNFYQIFKGEKKSGVTLHKIDSGIDTGDIIDKVNFVIKINDTAFQNYFKLMKYSTVLFKRNFKSIIDENYKIKKQKLKKGSYFSRQSIKYKNLINIKKIDNKMSTHNLIRSLIFPPFQHPVYEGKKIKKTFYKNNKIKLLFL